MVKNCNDDNLVYYGKLIGVNMKIILILICGLLLQNCSGNNKKVIKSPDDLQSFVNVFCAFVLRFLNVFLRQAARY